MTGSNASGGASSLHSPIAFMSSLTLHSSTGGGSSASPITCVSNLMPPSLPLDSSLLVFVTDDQKRLAHVIWRGLRGTSAVAHEFSQISARADGPKLEIVRTKGLSSAIQRLTVPGAWTLDEALALEHLPLWIASATARPEQAEWVSIELLPGPKPQRIRLAQQGKETIKVGGHEIATWRYQAVAEAPVSSVIWVDEQGFVVRRLVHEEGDASTQWDTIYVPLAGDRLSR